MNHSRIRYAVVILGGVAALAVGGCSGGPAGPAPQPTLVPSTAPSAVPVAPAADSAAKPALKFPNTSNDVIFTRYDAVTKMVEFHRVVMDPKGLIPDPGDRVVHELPMAANAKVVSRDPHGFPYETCPPTSCTPDLVMESVIGHHGGQFYAHMHVNAADRIDNVRESAY